MNRTYEEYNLINVKRYLPGNNFEEYPREFSGISGNSSKQVTKTGKLGEICYLTSD